MNKELIKMILAFREDRNWEQFHNPKDLAISLNISGGQGLRKREKYTEL
ncbi:hypothetical protein [Paenibacillus macerans]